MEDALLIPKGYLSLREAVIRLAETQAPTAGVRKYLEQDEASWPAIMMSWPAAVPFYCHGTVVTAPVAPAWDALMAARDKLWQTLGDGDLIGVQLSFSTDQLAPIKPEPWRIREGFAAFQSDRLDGGRVLLREAEFIRWMAAGAPTVTTEADATAPSADSHYPAVGDIPEHRHLTACEVLTWIGYGRAISQDVYFAPFAKASGLPAEERASLLHRSVPDPKPPDDPMDNAQRKLMEAVLARRVHMLTERNGAFEDMPAAIYEHAVVVYARGSIEADWNAPERDRERAITYRSSLAPIGDVWFRKSEVLEACPNWAPTDTTQTPSANERAVDDTAAKQAAWGARVKRQRGKEKVVTALDEWALEIGKKLPGGKVLLPGRTKMLAEHRRQFEVTPRINEQTMAEVQRRLVAARRAELPRGGAPMHAKRSE